MSELERLWQEIGKLRGRLAELETMEYRGRAVYADTAGDADTVDGLDAAESGADAHVLATDASGNATLSAMLTLLGTLVMPGTSSGIRLKFISRKQTAGDNVATGIFKVSTTDEASNDGGSYACFVLADCAHADAPSSQYVAARAYLGAFAHASKNDGTGVDSAVTELLESASAATASGTRDIAGVVMTVATSGFDTTASFAIDVNGSTPANGFVSCWVLVLYSGYTTPPVIAAV